MDLLDSAQRLLRQYLVARGIRTHSARFRGHAVHWYAIEGRGRGAPVVLLHGLGGNANGFFRLLLPLAQRFSRVLAPDLPGHGFSPLPAGGALPLRAQIDLLDAFLSEVVGRPAFLVGNSLGAAMGVVLARERPEWVRALALVPPAGARLSAEQREALARRMRVKTTAEARELTRSLFHRTPWVSLLFGFELRKLYGTPAVAAAFEELKGIDGLDSALLAGLQIPTLVLWGGSEKLLPADGVEYFRRHLPTRARVEVVEGFGHVPQVERPSQLVHYLVEFADQYRL